MEKIDVIERIKRAEIIVHQLEGLDSEDEAVVKILQELIETIKPIDCLNPNFVKLRDAVDEIILYHKKSALESEELPLQENRVRSLTILIEFFNCFKVDFNWKEDFGPVKLISAADEQKK